MGGRRASRCRSRYRFEPGAADDGVTLLVPEPLVQLLEADELAWLVPGWRLELVTAIFRALPKALRKLLVPVPEHASKALADISASPASGFLTSLSRWITRQIGSPVTAAALAQLKLPDHLRINIRVLDVSARVLAEGRDLALIRRTLRIAGAAAARPLLAAPGPLSEGRVPPSGAEPAMGSLRLHRKWDFGELPRTCAVERNGLLLEVHPALEDRQSGVAIVEAHSLAEAERISAVDWSA